MLNNEQIENALDLMSDLMTSGIEIWMQDFSIEKVKEVLTVDKLKLDEAEERITQDFYFFGILQSWANDAVDMTKSEMEQVSAKLDIDIRANPEKYNIDKVTEKGVASAIMLQQEYIDAEAEYQKAKMRAGIFFRMMNALEKKAKAVDTLAKLYLGDYYTLTKGVPDKVKSEMTTAQVRTNEEKALSESPRLKKRNEKEKN